MRILLRCLLAAPLFLLPVGCATTTPQAATPPSDTSAAKPGEGPKTASPSSSPPLRLRIPSRPSPPDGTFDRVWRACNAARDLGDQRVGLGRLAAQQGVVAALAPPLVTTSGLDASLKAAQADLAKARDAEQQAEAERRERAARPAPGAVRVPETPPATALLAPFARSYGVFLDQAAAVVKQCDSLRGDLKPAAMDDLAALAALSDKDLRALESQKKAFAENVSLGADSSATSLAQLLENQPNGAPGSAGASQVPGLGSLENVILQGLADFVVTRAKAEAVTWVQRRLSKELCDREPMATQLSHTCLAFKELSKDLSLQAMGSYLQAAALSDLEGLPESLLAVSKDRQDLAAALHLGIMVSREVYAGQSPLDVVRSIRQVMCGAAPDAKAFGGIAQAACRASTLVDAIARQRRPAGSVSTQAPNDVGMLAVAALRATVTALGDAGAPLSGLPAGRFEAMAADTLALAAEVESIEKDLQALVKEAKGGTVPAGARLAVTSRAVASFVRAARITVCLTKGVTFDATADADPALAALAGVESAAEFASALFSHDAAGLGLAVQAALRLLPDQSGDPGVAVLRKMLPLIVELASAKKSADVATALEAAAAPVGSYEAKYDRSSIAINAFLGVSAGPETTPTGKWAGVGALYAPVGLHMTTPLGGEQAQFHGGLFVSVIDIGALTATRLSTELGTTDGETPTVDTAPNIGFAQIFSPGLFFTLGLGRSPIVVGGGAAVTPALRKAITLADGVSKTDELPAVRVQGFVAVDLTLLPF